MPIIMKLIKRDRLDEAIHIVLRDVRIAASQNPQLHADKRERGDVVLGLPQGAYGGTRERDVKIAAAWIAGFR